MVPGWMREQNDAGVEFPNITPDVSRRVALMRLPRLKERADRALVVIARKWPGLEHWVALRELSMDLELQGRSYSADAKGVDVLLHLLTADGYLRKAGTGGMPGMFGLSVNGLLTAEAFGAGQSGSAQGFVAMSFDEGLTEAWTGGFDPAIRAAGFRPLRIDNKEYVGGVSDEIIAEIRESNFVVADYTQQRNGVYFEAGLALGLGLTVIPTCRADEISKLHFDIKHLNTLPWADPAKLGRPGMPPARRALHPHR
jgi:hypothetical protein